MSEKSSPEFQGADDEIQLLFEATRKVEEDYKGFDWEAKRNKCDRILELTIQNPPKDGDSEKYLNDDMIKTVITKERVSVRPKKIRIQFRKLEKLRW